LLLDCGQCRCQGPAKLSSDSAGIEADTEIDLTDSSCHVARLSTWPADQILVRAATMVCISISDAGSVMASITSMNDTSLMWFIKNRVKIRI
jgi:hypothetical protein